MKGLSLLLFLMPLSLVTVAQSSVRTDTISIQGDHGKLRAIVQRPRLTAGKCPVAVLMHGFMGNKQEPLLSGISSKLLAEGIATVRFDFNGHGQSEGLFADMTVPNEIEDAKCVVRHVLRLPYVSRVAVAGHSQGGVVAGMTAGEMGADTICSVVLLAPAAVLRDDAIRGSTMGASYDPLALKGDYVVLPWSGRHLGRKFIESAFSLPIYETSARFTGRACIIHGTGDKIAPYSYGERYHELWAGSELHVIPRADHGFSRHLDDVTTMAAAFLSRTLKDARGVASPHRAASLAATFVMELKVKIGAPIAVGSTPRGLRTVIPIRGGTFEGPLLRGEILDGGADYQLSDTLHGRTGAEAIYCIRTDDGVTIHVRNEGIIADSGYFVTSPRFEAPQDSPYGWLNNATFICKPGKPSGEWLSLLVWKVE